MPVWVEAGLWGLLGGAALVVGALVAWSLRVPDGVEDDVAVLAVRAHPVDGERPPGAGPEILPPAVPSLPPFS